MSEELNPCPFCGDPMVISHGILRHVSQTDGCPLKQIAWGHDLAFQQWNTREDMFTAERNALRAEVDRLRKNEAAIRADERAKVIAEAVKVAEAQGIACSQFFRDHQKSPNVYEQLDIVADDLRSLAALKGGDA